MSPNLFGIFLVSLSSTRGQNMKSNGVRQLDMFPREVFIDGSVFVNDPELTALWAVRMQWKKMTNYHLLSVV
jgi:hypothetical protein